MVLARSLDSMPIRAPCSLSFLIRALQYTVITQRWKAMKVGDLVEHSGYLGLIVCANDFETLVRWFDDGTVEDADNYTIGLEVISESR